MTKNTTEQNGIEANLEITLRAYETAHSVWFKTSTFSPAYASVTAFKNQAKAEYVAAYRIAKPGVIIF